MGSLKSGARGALHARCSKLWGMFHVPSGMHTVLLLTILAWLCYLGAWLLLDFSLGNHLQVSRMPCCADCELYLLVDIRFLPARSVAAITWTAILRNIYNASGEP